jgi:tripartite-type tricarboxylate transporter receptor subunit TctC
MKRFASMFAGALGVAMAIGISQSAAQEVYPAKPVRIIVPYSPGGGTDVMARIVAQRLGDALRQTFVVENRPGAGGIIGLEAMYRSPADGYTLAMMPSNLSILGPLYQKLPFDPIADFAPIAMVGSSPVMIGGHASAPFASFRQFIDYAKANPGKLTFASCGTASPQHIAGEYLKLVAGIDIVHVPYKGCGQAIVDVLSGTVPVFFSTVAHLNPQIKAGKLRAYAVTGQKRTPLAPEVPTVAESGFPDFNVDVWFGLLAPGRTPRDVVAKLNAEVNSMLGRADVRELFAQQFYTPVGGTSAEFAAVIRGDLERFARPIKEAGIKPQ